MDYSLKELLYKYGFTLKKSLGQNFLSDKGVLDAIVDKGGITDSDTVVEIGCGAGTLTEKLSERAKKVYGFEVDTSLKKLLADRFAGSENVEITFKDIMKIPTADLEKEIGCKYKVVANLPYYITTPIILKFIREAKNAESLVIMVQKEVALRLSAKVGSADYGAITATIGLVGNARIIENVDKTKFLPPPKVDSAVVRIDIDRNKYKGVDAEKYDKAVRCAFNNRRKTLSNNVMSCFGVDRVTADGIVESLGKDKMVRGESLSVEDFIKFSEKF